MKKQKLASLLPSLKEKRRYVVFQILSEQPFSFEEVKETILSEAHSFLGRLQEAKANLEFLPDWMNNKGIIKVTHSSLDHLKSTLLLIRKINKREAIVTSIGVSGTLHKARTKFITHS